MKMKCDIGFIGNFQTVESTFPTFKYTVRTICFPVMEHGRGLPYNLSVFLRIKYKSKLRLESYPYHIFMNESNHASNGKRGQYIFI